MRKEQILGVSHLTHLKILAERLEQQLNADHASETARQVACVLDKSLDGMIEAVGLELQGRDCNPKYKWSTELLTKNARHIVTLIEAKSNIKHNDDDSREPRNIIPFNQTALKRSEQKSLNEFYYALEALIDLCQHYNDAVHAEQCVSSEQEAAGNPVNAMTVEEEYDYRGRTLIFAVQGRDRA